MPKIRTTAIQISEVVNEMEFADDQPTAAMQEIENQAPEFYWEIVEEDEITLEVSEETAKEWEKAVKSLREI